jgi:hypothetical protein
MALFLDFTILPNVYYLWIRFTILIERYGTLTLVHVTDHAV